MKKILSIILCSMMVLSFTGCDTEEIKKEIVKNPEEVKQQIQKEIKDVIGDDEEISFKDKKVKFSEDDSISVALKEMGYKIEEGGYALYPNNEFYYPEYLRIDNELVTVYLSKDSIETFESNLYDRYYDGTYNNSVVMSNNGQLNVFGMGTADSNSKGGIFSGLFDGSDDVMYESESIAVSAPMVSESYIPETEFNTSEYENVEVASYMSVNTNPLSTFAADVDTASYSNFRSILRNSIFNDDDYYNEELHDLRIEEMLNYFDYSYNSEDYDKFNISAEISDTPWNKDSKLLVVNIKAKELSKEENEGSNLVFLVDTSGSMDDELKLPLLKDSLKLLVNELTEKDRVSLVTYSGHEEVVIDGVNGSKKDEILEAIDRLVPYGSTNGEGGLKKAYEIAEKYKDSHNNSRIIMCSDGDLNVGMSSQDDLYDFVTKKRETGVYLSVLGFGLGNYKDNKMETLADNGNGNYHYIDNIKEGEKVLVNDLMSTLVTIADDVKFQLEFNPAYIKGYRKIGYENRNLQNEDFHDDTKDGGEVGYGHEVTVVYEIVPVDSEIDIPGSDLKYRKDVEVESDIKDWLTVSIRYKDHGEKKSDLIEYIVDESHYTETPSDDWKFISDAVGFGLIVNNSDNKGTLTLTDIIKDLNSMELSDQDKEEFLSIVIGYRNYLTEMDNED